MTDVVVIGSLNLDLVVSLARLPRPGETVAGPSAVRSPGGKGANQAVAAARLGGHVRLAGLVGDDTFGTELRQSAAAQGVDVSQVGVVEDISTGTAFIMVEDGGENMITIAAGANGAVTPETLGGDEGLARLLEGAGALLLQLEIPTATCVAAARTARELGVPVVLNAAPSPSAITPELAQLLRLTDVLIVNETEAGALTGSTDPAALRALGPAVGVVTLGRHGASADDGTGRVDVPGFTVASVDTVGAGDTFCGQFTLSHAAGTPPYEALLRSCAAGALATTVRGTRSGPTHDQVESLVSGTG
ncbi:ribokinase [Streptomyces sp. NBC_01506]|uniref:ribokinase n=1 Tax=Streptomyces sp. NBC_01506 TaxID=2903887 RepID=UPI003864FAB9